MLNQLIKPIAHVLPENNRFERIWLLAKFDFLKRYYGSFLGLVWALINPLAQLGIYYFIFTVIWNNDIPNYGLFVFLGIVIWFFFMESTNKSLMLIHSKRYLLENIQINWMDIYYASLLSTFFAFLFNFIIYCTASVFFGVELNWTILFFPLLVINLLIFVFACKLILSIVYIYVRDIVHFWSIFTMILFWLSGILFIIDPASPKPISLLIYLTPLIGIITNARAILIYGDVVNWTIFIYDFVYSFGLLALSLVVFKKYYRKALEKL